MNQPSSIIHVELPDELPWVQVMQDDFWYIMFVYVCFVLFCVVDDDDDGDDDDGDDDDDDDVVVVVHCLSVKADFPLQSSGTCERVQGQGTKRRRCWIVLGSGWVQLIVKRIHNDNGLSNVLGVYICPGYPQIQFFILTW